MFFPLLLKAVSLLDYPLCRSKSYSSESFCLFCSIKPSSSNQNEAGSRCLSLQGLEAGSFGIIMKETPDLLRDRPGPALADLYPVNRDDWHHKTCRRGVERLSC
jgi:hypothetical protein